VQNGAARHDDEDSLRLSAHDAGEVILDGGRAHFGSPEEAIAAGIGMLHQDPLDVPALSVLDNFMLGRENRLRQRRSEAKRELLALCRRFGFDLDPEVLAGSLTMGERQQLELVRLLAVGVQVIILDEPTTGISAPQKVQLFRALRELASEGLSVLFVSHKLDEVVELCDAVTVLRAGSVAGGEARPFVTDDLVQMMFGQCLSDYPRPAVELGDVMLQLESLAVHTYRLKVEGISLSVREGEVIGLAGLEGSGQRLLMQACAGLLPAARGRILLGGQDVTHRSPHDFLEMGVAFVPAARLEEGMVGGLTIREHFALAGQNGDGPFIDWAKADARTQQMIREFNIVGRPDSDVRSLSGGNQQRTLLALLPERVRLLIMEHPTRGLDVGSARWVWSKLLERRAQGTAILFTSTDLDELVENSDRIVVFSGGAMSPPVCADEITCEELGYLIGGRHA
jgi:simple sugar transport system ATP-binding protein